MLVLVYWLVYILQMEICIGQNQETADSTTWEREWAQKQSKAVFSVTEIFI